jgi:hypothetical protein
MAVSVAGTVLLILANTRILSRAAAPAATGRPVARWGISPKPA